MKKKVLMLGSVLSVKGGMTAVVNNFLNWNFENCEITYFPTHYNKGNILNIILFFLNLPVICLKMLKSDCVHMHMSERGSCIRKYICFKFAYKMKKKIIIHMHGAEFKEYYSGCGEKVQNKILNMLLKADYVITLGDNWKNYVLTLSSDINTIILKNTVPKSDVIVERNNECFNILFLGIIDKRKGIYDLIEAVKQITKNDFEKSLNFIIAGTGNDEEEIKKIINDLGINNYFEFTGWISAEQKKEVLSKSHLLVLPSYNEGLPVSIVEAMSYGMPIISTNVGSINEAVFNRINGYLLEPGDVEGLSQAIKEIVENTQLWEQFSNNSLEIFNRDFDNENYFKKIRKLYEE